VGPLITRIQALHYGAFVWADAFTAEALFPIPFSSTISNEFSVRATGGVRFVTAIDSDGVALAAIQGLNEIVKEKDARISALEKQNASLERRLAALEKLVVETTANGTGKSR